MRRAMLALSVAVVMAAAIGGSWAQTEQTSSGTVVSALGDALVIRTDTGELRFVMDADVDRPTNLRAGDRVDVTYTMRGSDRVVSRVRTGNPTSTGSMAGTTGSARTTMSSTGTVVSTSGDMLVVRTDTGETRYVVESGTVLPSGLRPGDRVDVTYFNRDDDRVVSRVSSSTAGTAALPRTASSLALIACVGLLSLAGGLVLRAFSGRW
jgi:hypothetical protein